MLGSGQLSISWTWILLLKSISPQPNLRRIVPYYRQTVGDALRLQPGQEVLSICFAIGQLQILNYATLFVEFMPILILGNLKYIPLVTQEF